MKLLSAMKFKKTVLATVCIALFNCTTTSMAQTIQGGGKCQQFPPRCSGLSCLPIIASHTKCILEQVNNIPGYLSVYLTSLTKMADAWLKTEDQSDPSASVIGQNLKPFSDYASNSESTLATQIQNTKEFSKAFLLAGANLSSGNPTATLPTNANQLVYSIVLQQPIDESKYPGLNNKQKTEDQRNKLKAQFDADINAYIKNVSGLNFLLPQPMNGDTPDVVNYRTFYNLLTATQSYNTFILSSLVYQNVADQITQKLMTIASDNQWFVKIGSEDLGLVLRHILMYCTGMFMELDQIQQMLRQGLMMQAMGSSMQATYYESILTKQTTMPSPPPKHPYIPS